MVATAVTLIDLEGHSPLADVYKCNPSNICAAFTRFQLTVCSHGFSALAELLVHSCVPSPRLLSRSWVKVKRHSQSVWRTAIMPQRFEVLSSLVLKYFFSNRGASLIRSVVCMFNIVSCCYLFLLGSVCWYMWLKLLYLYAWRFLMWNKSIWWSVVWIGTAHCKK